MNGRQILEELRRADVMDRRYFAFQLRGIALLFWREAATAGDGDRRDAYRIVLELRRAADELDGPQR